jgi:arginine utilization protein RocB
MLNIDKLKAEYIETLKREGFYIDETNEKPTIYIMLQEYNRTRSIKTAADIVENLKHYVLLTRDEFETLTEMAAKAQAIANKQRKAARRTNRMLTPQQLSERNRKAAIARWNRIKDNKLIQDIK